MKWGVKTRVNNIQKRFFYAEDGLRKEDLESLFPSFKGRLEFSFLNPAARHDDNLNIIFLPYQADNHDWNINEMLGSRNYPEINEIQNHLDDDAIVLIFDPESKSYKYYDYYPADKLLEQINIDYTKPSDVQIAKSFIFYIKDMINKPYREWDWNLNTIEMFYVFNGETYTIRLNDNILLKVFSSDAWYMNKELDQLFFNMLRPFSDKIDEKESNEKKIYCRFYFPEESDSQNASVIYAEIMNDYTLAIDTALFTNYSDKDRDDINGVPQLFSKNNALDYIYKPYLYHAFFDTKSIPQKHLRSIHENPNTIYCLNIQIINKSNVKKTNLPSLTFAASPQITHWFKPFWKDFCEAQNVNVNAVSKLPLPCNHNLSKAENDKLDQFFSSKIKLNIHRVGQANFVYCHNEKVNKHLLVDCGIPLPTNIRLANQGIKKRKDKVDYSFISKIGPDLIIISHWDYDHYSGLYSLSRNAWQNKELLILAPYKAVNSFGEPRKCFLKYLLSRNALCLLETPAGKKDDALYVNSRGYSIFQGKGKDNNNRSLLIRLKRTILPGDCEDSFWPIAYGNPYGINEVVLPHHGAKGVFQKSGIALCMSQTNKPYNIYVCAGYNNHYEHPSVDWFMVSGSKQINCILECTNIGNPEETNLKKRIPNANKDVITIDDA
jgi:hypothetical protein